MRLSNVPRIRDVETMVELLADLGADVEWTGPNEVRVDARGVEKTDLDAGARTRDPRVVPARRAAARALRARRPCRLRAATSSAAAGSTRMSTPSRRSAPTSRIDGVYEISSNGLRGTRMYLDEASVMGTENAIMAAVLAEGETILGQRGLRAAHPGSLPLPRLARRADRRHRLERPPHHRASTELERRRAPDRPRPHRGRELRRPRGGRPAARSSSRTSSRTTSSRSSRRSASSGSRWRSRTRSVRVPAGQSLHDRGRPRRPDPEDRERRLARVPGRPDVDRGHRRDAGAGHDPHLREDVREPALLRRQARLDGRADHPLRPAPRRRHRARRRSTASASRARTSAPAWRW